MNISGMSNPRPRIAPPMAPIKSSPARSASPASPGSEWYRKLQEEILSGTSRILDRAKSLAENLGKALSPLGGPADSGFGEENGLLERLFRFFENSYVDPKSQSQLERGLQEAVKNCGPDFREECPAK